VKNHVEEFLNRHSKDCPLYGRLCEVILGNDDISSLFLEAPKSQRLPVLLFAIVQDLLLSNIASSHPLKLFYPNFGGDMNCEQDIQSIFGTHFCQIFHLTN
jgi:hypothetical protein